MTGKTHWEESDRFCPDCKISAPLYVDEYSASRVHICTVCNPDTWNGAFAPGPGVFFECGNCKAIFNYTTAAIRCVGCLRMACDACIAGATAPAAFAVCSLQCGPESEPPVTALAVPPSPLRE